MGGARTEFTVHVQGLMHILNSEAARHWHDGFSRNVMGITSLLAVRLLPPLSITDAHLYTAQLLSSHPSICPQSLSRDTPADATKISESLTNPNIQFTPQFVPAVKASGPSPGPRQSDISDPETIKLENLLNYPKYLNEPELHLDEIRERYEQARLESQMLVGLIAGMIGAQQQQQQQRQRQSQASGSSSASTSTPSSSSSSSQSSPPPSPAAFIRMYILCEAGAGTLISVATLLNQILQIFHPDDKSLQHDTEYFAAEVINVAERVKHLRPLGCTFVPPTLCMAVVTTQDAGTRAKLRELIRYYHADFRGAKPSDFTSWLEMRFNMMRERAGKGTTSGVQSDSGIESSEESNSLWDELSSTGTRPCCIM